MGSPLVARHTAIAKQTHHQFIKGIGYLAHEGPPELPRSANGKKNTNPPAGTKTGFVGLLRPPTGGNPVRFVWVSPEGAWASPAMKGNRMAWTTTYLQLAGWEYVGPADDEKKPGKKR
jgi:hypothetical protein